MLDFSDMQQFANPVDGSSFDMSTFQQPFVPHEIWQMPMNFEYDWSDIQQSIGPHQFVGMDAGVAGVALPRQQPPP
jgi:hypothetical protein